jgi:hypothetical protein
MMKKAFDFYLDFLTIEKDKKLVFAPSYSPENFPKNYYDMPISVNATMDVMAVQQLLKNLIYVAKKYGDSTHEYKKMLEKMPEYAVSNDGCFKEWLWDNLNDSNNHRHVSHFYALYDERPAEIVNNKKLVNAIDTSLKKRFEFRKKDGDMAFGTFGLGITASHIKNKKWVTEALTQLVCDYWSNSLASYHNRFSLFNMDISGGLPYLISKCLIYSDIGYIELLPSIPDEWLKAGGEIKGLLLRGGIELNTLKWQKNSTIDLSLISKKDQEIIIELNDKIDKVKLTKGVMYERNFSL